MRKFYFFTNPFRNSSFNRFIPLLCMLLMLSPLSQASNMNGTEAGKNKYNNSSIAATAAVSVVQAENYISQSGGSVRTITAVNGENITIYDFGGNGSYAEWAYNSAAAGTAKITFRYANGSTGNRQGELKVNGSTVQNVAFSSNGDWNIYQTVTVNVNLVKGNNTIRVTANTSNGGPNMDRLEIETNSGYRYLRLTALGGVTTYNVYVAELKWMAGSTAYPKTPATSTATDITATTGQTTAWKAYDGTLGIGYLWNSESTTYPYSITIDLGSGGAITPTAIQIGTQWQGRAMSGFKCEGSNDKSSWTHLYTKTGLAESDWQRDAMHTFDFSGSGTADTQAPTAPAGLSASNIADKSFTLKWNASTDNVGVASYEVFVGSVSKGTTTATSMNLTGLTCNTSYSVTVKAKDAAGNVSAASTALSVKTAQCPVVNLLSNGEFNSGTTGWTSIFQGPAAGGGSFGVVTDAAMSGTNAGKVSISNGGTENWNVELYSLFNLQSGKTYEVTFRAKAEASRTALVIFQKGSDPYTHYWEQSVNLTTTSQTFGPFTWTSNITDPSTRLNFKIGGSNADVWVDAVVVREVTATADTQAPTAPSSLTASSVTQNSFTLSWAASSDNVGVTSYEVFAGSVSKGTTTATSMSVTGLNCGTSYSMTVRAKDAAGNVSAASAARSVTTSTCPVAAPNEKSMLGMNMTGVRSWSKEQVFTNLAHHSLAWLPIDSEPNFGNRISSSDLTADKYLKPGASGRLCVFWDLNAAVLTPGDYVFKYSGSATVRLSSYSTSGITQVSSASGRLVVNIPDLGRQVFLYFDVTNNSSTNPIKNIRFTELSRENSTDVFRPEFVKEYETLKAYRFMDWMHTNNSTISAWEDYTADNALIQTGPVSFNFMIDLSNQTRSDAWFCVPMLADDNFVRQMARKIRDNLRPEARAYIELSNEVWNGQFTQDNQAAAKANELGISNTGKVHEDAAAYHGYRSAQIEKIFEEEFAKVSTKPKLTTLIAWQAANHWILRNWVFPFYRQVMGSSAIPEAIAIAPYFGGGLGSEGNAPIVQNWSSDKVMNQILTGAHSSELEGTGGTTLAQAIDHIKSYKAMVDDYKIPLLLAYEGGQHLSGVRSAADNQTLTNLFMEANRNRKMYDAYIQYFDAWKANGGDLFATFASTASWGKSGSWGWKEFQFETRAQAPKYDAILTWNSNNQTLSSGSSAMRTASVEVVEEAFALDNGILIYPNPAKKGQVTIQFDKAEANTLTIYNMNGKVHVNRTVDQGSTIINLDSFKAGIYIFKINGISQKVIIQ